ncbi:MAG: hypothetical protein DCC67_11040 [Planctomycetota bacterium]|nr:MAG: hypothetical protein DCC67_11040 [Planctomycetota bacterium]
MSEPIKTMAFVVVGALALTAAYFIDAPKPDVNVEQLEGKMINDNFEVDAPRRLKIVKFDQPTAETRQFEVASIDGVWRIPSKQDYPADATRQMAAAANALMDRKILRVESQSADSHEELGVVDPLAAKLDSNSEGVGTRVQLFDAEDQPLVDMIIGKKVKDADNQRYVRRSNQDVVFVVELDPASLSTDFNDWIEDDLLKLSPFDIRQVFINDYSADLGFGMTADGRLQPRVNWDRRGQSTVKYNNDEAKWELAELKKFDPQTKEMVESKLAEDEELNQDALSELRNGLDDLLIVDVARKPEGLSADLKAGNDFLTNNEAFQDLISKGFSPVPLQPGAEPEILSSEGELICTLRDGVEYVLRFGQLQVQTDSAADASEGETTPADPTKGEAAKDAAADAADAASDAAEGEKKADEDGKNLRRYLFVMARFNQDVIEKPKLKELPATPEGQPAPAAPAAADAAPEAAGGDEPAAANAAEPTDEQSPSEAAAGDSAGADAAKEGEAQEPTAEEQAAQERKKIEEENKRLQDEYQQTVEKGKKRVTELNERFGDWYYVISNDVYKQIHLGVDQLVKKKEKPADAAQPGAAADEANPLSGLPNLPIGDSAAPAADAAAAAASDGAGGEPATPPAANEPPQEPAAEPAATTESEPAASEAAAPPAPSEPVGEPAEQTK